MKIGSLSYLYFNTLPGLARGHLLHVPHDCVVILQCVVSFDFFNANLFPTLKTVSALRLAGMPKDSSSWDAQKQNHDALSDIQDASPTRFLTIGRPQDRQSRIQRDIRGVDSRDGTFDPSHCTLTAQPRR